MKFKIALFVVIVFLTVIGIQAQPAPYYGFSPNDQCLSFSKDETIFAGRVVTFGSYREPLPDVLKTKDRSYFDKVVISVEYILNGKLSEKTIEIFSMVSYPYLTVGDYHIFVASEFINADKTISFISKRWSQRLNDIDKKEQNFFFSNIKDKLKIALTSDISGKVVRRKENPSIDSPLVLTNRNLSEVGSNINFFIPVEGITVEAIRENDGKAFQTKTDKNGYYRFDAQEGSYKIHLTASKGFEEVPSGYTSLIYKIQSESEKNKCYQRVFFEVKKR